VILLDVVIGFGAADDPAGALVPTIRDGIARAERAGRRVAVVASVCGTSRDFQGYEEQRRKLIDAGVSVLPNNAAATRHALSLISDPTSPGPATEREATPGPIVKLLESGPTVINIGLRSFAETLHAAGVTTVQYNWAPAAGGNARLARLLRALHDA
jgi:FdrA protein